MTETFRCNAEVSPAVVVTRHLQMYNRRLLGFWLQMSTWTPPNLKPNFWDHKRTFGYRANTSKNKTLVSFPFIFQIDAISKGSWFFPNKSKCYTNFRWNFTATDMISRRIVLFEIQIRDNITNFDRIPCRYTLKYVINWRLYQHIFNSILLTNDTLINTLCFNNDVSLRWPILSLLATTTTVAVTSGEIDLLHKSHNAPVPYSTMQHFVTEMCRCVHISVTK